MIVTFSAKLRHSYKSWSKHFNDRNHMNNYIKLMTNKGYHFIGIHYDSNNDLNLVEAQENAYFDNFCINNNI
jgi:hypothetical protein